ncbi:MAG: O-antigen ligase family protein [Verrucomicrobia bacterium]|nr:O-antigen ligase family protein [Verrucomicrobiota bacterium]
MIVQPQHRFMFLYPFRIANLCMIIATGLHVFSCLTEGRPLIRFGPATKLALALLGFGLLSQYAGVFQTSTAWNGYIDMLVKNAYTLILIEAMALTVDRVWAVHTTLAIASLWWIKGGLRLSAAGATWGMGDRIMGPAAGLVQDPNFFAYMMGVFIPLYFYYYRHAHKAYIRWGALAVTLFAVFISLRTGSRSGMIQLFLLGLILFPRLVREEKRALAIAGLGLFLLLPFVGEQNFERFRKIPRSIAAYLSGTPELHMDPDTYSSMERRTKNTDTLALIKKHPLFGVGMSPDERLFAQDYWGATGQVHCEILMAGRQMGLIGMAMHVGFLVIPFLMGWRVQRRFGSTWPALSGLGFMIKLQAIMFGLGGLFLPLPWHPILMILAGSSSALWSTAGALDPSGVPSLSEVPAETGEETPGLLPAT